MTEQSVPRIGGQLTKKKVAYAGRVVTGSVQHSRPEAQRLAYHGIRNSLFVPTELDDFWSIALSAAVENLELLGKPLAA